MTYFRSDRLLIGLFSMWPIFEVIDFNVTQFGSHPFQSDLSSKWSIRKSHFRSDRFRSKLFSKWSVSKWPAFRSGIFSKHFLSDRLRIDIFSIWPNFEVIDFNLTPFWKWPIFGVTYFQSDRFGQAIFEVIDFAVIDFEVIDFEISYFRSNRKIYSNIYII